MDHFITAVVGRFQKWLHLPDPGGLLMVLATVVANIVPGDPVWVLLIGPPSAGKNELLYPLRALPRRTRFVSTLSSEGALLSASSAQGNRAGATGGLLMDIGEFGFLVMKDFTSILSMHREKRAEILGALREVYDGHWTRAVGIDGGRQVNWNGKLALIGGCTEAIDQAHSVMSMMGERFVLFHLPPTDGPSQARRALGESRGAEREMRQELEEVVRDLFASLAIPDGPPPLCSEDRERLVALASLAVRCRSSVERNFYSREIEAVPEPEAPARLARCLSQLLVGFRVLEVDERETWRLLKKCALDSMPTARRRSFDSLEEHLMGVALKSVVAETAMPETPVRRALEDMEALGIARRKAGTDTTRRGDLWCLTDWAIDQWIVAEGYWGAVESR